MSVATKKLIVIIAGPNGAGKTTFAQEFLPKEALSLEFINADLIAEGLSPSRPEWVAIKAGKLMVQEIDNRIHRGSSFAFETTLSSKRYLRLIPRWRQLGFQVRLIFLSLSNVDAAIRRVAIRVQQGGHDVPEKTIRRRFSRGLTNFTEVYKNLVDAWVLYDNSGELPVLIDTGENK